MCHVLQRIYKIFTQMGPFIIFMNFVRRILDLYLVSCLLSHSAVWYDTFYVLFTHDILGHPVDCCKSLIQELSIQLRNKTNLQCVSLWTFLPALEPALKCVFQSLNMCFLVPWDFRNGFHRTTVHQTYWWEAYFEFRDKIEKSHLSVACLKTRMRFCPPNREPWDEIENFCPIISKFETRSKIFNDFTNTYFWIRE